MVDLATPFLAAATPPGAHCRG